MLFRSGKGARGIAAKKKLGIASIYPEIPFWVVNFLLLLVKKKLILPAVLPLSVLPGRRITASLSQPVYTKTAPGTYRMQLESHTEFQKTSSTKFAELTLHEYLSLSNPR